MGSIYSGMWIISAEVVSCDGGGKDVPMCTHSLLDLAMYTDPFITSSLQFYLMTCALSNSSGDIGGLQSPQTSLCEQLSPSVGSMCCISNSMPGMFTICGPPAQVNNQSAKQT